MSLEINMGNCVVAPFKVEEGKIDIVETAGIGGTKKEPVLQYPVKKGDLVEIAADMRVKALSSGVPIGFVYNTPKWTEAEPKINYTAAEAKSADMLREAGIETFFKKIVTMAAKASEGITVGKYLVLKDEVELSSSSGTTATNAIALSAQDSNDRVIVGIL